MSETQDCPLPGWRERVMRFLTGRAAPREGSVDWLFREEEEEARDFPGIPPAERQAKAERIKSIDALVATFDADAPPRRDHV